MISKFFIDRPVFATGLSIVIVLAGLIAMRALPVAQYPGDRAAGGRGLGDLSRARAPQTIAETVAAPLEQQINGVENMIYMHSTSTGAGHPEPLRLLPDRHRRRPGDINVNNRVQRATAVLPEEVRRQGVTVTSGRHSILQVVPCRRPTGATTRSTSPTMR